MALIRRTRVLSAKSIERRLLGRYVVDSKMSDVDH